MIEWHVDADDLAEYADGRAGPARRASVEAHLGRCDACRAALTAHVPVTRTELLWEGIADRIDTGRRSLWRSPRLAMVSLSSPPLALATTLVAGLLVVIVLGARLASARYATTALVSLGPIAPLAGAHLAFGRRVDPAGRMAPAAPMAAGRVAATRALVATVLACLVGLVLTPLTSLALADTIVWLLPALAVSALAVAMGTFVDATFPTVVLAAAWLVAVGAWLGGAPRALRGVSTDGLLSHDPVVQVVLVVATLAAIAVAVVRSDSDPAWRSA